MAKVRDGDAGGVQAGCCGVVNVAGDHAGGFHEVGGRGEVVGVGESKAEALEKESLELIILQSAAQWAGQLPLQY